MLEIFTTTWNEEKILPDFINWYKTRFPDCKITVWDNCSTDNTESIALSNNCIVQPFDTKDQMDEASLIWIRNNCWKNSSADWCLVVDADELVDVTPEFLKSLGNANIVKCEGYEMFGRQGDKIEDLKAVPSEGYSKPVLFKPWIFDEINFAPGSHSCAPIAKKNCYVLWSTLHPRLLHMKWRSWENGIERAKLLAQRRSEHSKLQGWNFHYELDESVHLDYYQKGLNYV